jgi:hypothetical protein
MKKIILFLFIIFSFSCRTNRVVYQKETTTVRDTIYSYKTIEKIKRVKDTLIISNPCDSLGMLTRFYSKLVLPNGNVTIRSNKNNIIATVNLDSISNIYEEKYKSKFSNLSQISTKIATKTVYPSWLITCFIFESLIILGYIYIKFIYRK